VTGKARWAAVGNRSCHLSHVTGHVFRCVLGFPGEEKNQPDAGANGGVGDVEGGKINDAAAALLQVKIKKIHDRVAAGQQAVGEVAGDAAKSGQRQSGRRAYAN